MLGEHHVDGHVAGAGLGVALALYRVWKRFDQEQLLVKDQGKEHKSIFRPLTWTHRFDEAV